MKALVAVALALAYALSFAALIFSGNLAAGFGSGVFAALIALAAGGLVMASFSRFKIAMAGPDSNPTAVLALVAGSIAVAPEGTRVPTMLAIIALATALTGALMLLCGALRASRAIRFIPEPMVGGFNAASGVLVFLGSLRVVGGARHPIELALAGLLAFAFFLGTRRFGPSAMPLLFLAAVALAQPVAALHAVHGFFSVPAAPPWFAWDALRGAIDWRGVLFAVPQMGVIALVSAATLLFNETGLELLTAQDADLDRELRLSGYANLAASLFGGMVSYVSFSRSSMNFQLGVRDRIAGICVGVAAIVALVVGPQHIVAVIPVFAVTGLLMALGANVAYRWLVQGARARARGDYLTICAIVATIVWLGFVPGVIVGLCVGCITFVVRYGRIDAVEHRWSGDLMRSTLQRSQHENEVLETYGDRIRIFRLRGFVFFGTADRLYRELVACAEAIDGVAWIVVDFGGVTGMDSSAAGAFAKFAGNVDADRVQFMVCGMRSRVAAIWNAALPGDLRPLVFDDRDLALEYCEGQLLLLFDSYAEAPATFDYWLAQQFGIPLASMIRPRLERMDLDTGDLICAQGEHADRVYFIERGRAAVLIGDLLRVRSIGPYSMVGEIGLYNNIERNATVVAETPTIAYALTRDALDAIETEDPLLATAFHGAVVRQLSAIIEQQNDVIASMAD